MTNFQAKTRFFVERNKDGFCYDRRENPHHVKIPEYPECQIADIVTNYFIARTTSAGTIRMDPQFRERAHREWFLDGVGFLRIVKERFFQCSWILVPEISLVHGPKLMTIRDGPQNSSKRL